MQYFQVVTNVSEVIAALIFRLEMYIFFCINTEIVTHYTLFLIVGT